MKIRWRAAKGVYYVKAVSMADSSTNISAFEPEEDINTPVFFSEKDERHLVLQYWDEQGLEWKDVQCGKDER